MADYIANVYRSNLIESRHRGDISVTAPDGKLLYYHGDPDKITYLRSAAKPFQTLPVITSKAADHFNFTNKEIAVMCASHNGEDIHIKAVKSILEKINVSEDKLQCGIHDPYYKEASHKLYLSGEKPTEIHNNCSGKHAALLALCKYNNWDLDNYLDKDHPVQKLMLKTICDITETKKDDILLGEDGCGVVVFGLSIKNMSLGFAKLANPEYLSDKYKQAAERITESIKEYPEMIAGTKRFNTDLIDAMSGKLTGKMGAEGVFCLGLYNGGPGICVKIEDGNSRAIPPVIIEVLKNLGYLSKENTKKLKKYIKPEVKNHHKHKVGYIEQIITLKESEV
ncbi:MAG: asparaginase [Bacillota bacterium]